jgi:uncharacterized membrane protein
MASTREPGADHGRAKRPVNVVAGPYGHPFHPILVTVPIGAWIASFVFDVASRFAGESDVFAKGSYWLIAIGVLGALIAAVLGLLDLLTIPTKTVAFRTGLTHMALNLAVVALFVVSFLVRMGDIDDPGEVGTGLIILSAVALAALGLSGWLGGKLTYRYGVRVAGERDQADGFRAP